MFKMRRVDLARILFDIQNEGRNYRFSILNRVWSRGGRMLYAFDPVENGEYIGQVSIGPPLSGVGVHYKQHFFHFGHLHLYYTTAV
jgi:hypothetical protein